MFCSNCGKEIPDDSVFCPECGNTVNRGGISSNNGYGDGSDILDFQGDVNMAVASYITWIGFIIAVVSDSQNSSFNKFHLNQALVINIAATVGCVIPLLGVVLLLASFVYAILGIISASEKSMRPLPLIDKIKLM